MFDLYMKMRRNEISEDLFIAECEKFIMNNPDKKSSNLLKKLLNEREHWLPSYTINLQHCDNDTSNRVEGFFGSLKNLIEHKIQTLANLVRAVYIRGESLLLKSLNEKRITKIPDHIISPEDIEKIGIYALTMILAEYTDLQQIGTLANEYGDNCCKNHMIYGIPCKHLLIKRIQEEQNPLLTLNDIPIRWMRFLNTVSNTQNTIEIIKKQKSDSNDWSYSSCVDKFERYFTFAARSQEVRRILSEALNSLNSVEHESGMDDDILPPSTLLVPGTPNTHPRRNVDKSGARRTKKKYRCSICGSDQHTAPRCPHSILNS